MYLLNIIEYTTASLTYNNYMDTSEDMYHLLLS